MINTAYLRFILSIIVEPITACLYILTWLVVFIFYPESCEASVDAWIMIVGITSFVLMIAFCTVTLAKKVSDKKQDFLRYIIMNIMIGIRLILIGVGIWVILLDMGCFDESELTWGIGLYGLIYLILINIVYGVVQLIGRCKPAKFEDEEEDRT